MTTNGNLRGEHHISTNNSHLQQRQEQNILKQITGGIFMGAMRSKHQPGLTLSNLFH